MGKEPRDDPQAPVRTSGPLRDAPGFAQGMEVPAGHLSACERKPAESPRDSS